MGSRGEERRIQNVEVYDVQKRRRPSKHYVYIIKVTWLPKTVNVIYRRYSRFFDFQNSLLEKFPLESGQLDPSQRIIPFLPGKIYFGRSHVRDVALKRLSQIDDYCKNLLSLDERISQCEEVQDFFSVEEDDVNPPTEEERKKKANFDTASKISEPRLGEQYRAIADYTKEDKWDLNLKAGTEVEVIEKTESGWWFVHVQDQQGWVPSTYLKRADGVKEEHGERARPGEEEQYICSEDYYPANPDELALTKGTIVEIVEKNLDGWWWVRQNGNEGWAPATYMMKAEKAHMERVARASGVQIVGKLEDISDLMQEDGDESWDDEPDPPPRPSKPYLSKKSRSLERGGSIRPPPRQNSIKNIKIDLKPLKEKAFQYVTIADFVDTVGDGISFSKGDNVEVKEKTSDGWWFVKIGNREGWAPSTYIESKEIEAIPEDNHVSNVNYDANYSEVAMDSDEEEYEYPESTPVHNSEYEEVNYEVPINVAGEGDKPKFAFLEPKNKPEAEIKERPCSVQPDKVELRLKKIQNAAIKRPTSKPPPPPTAMVTNKDNMSGPPPIDRSSLATALKNKLGSKAMEDVIKPDLEAQSSNSSSDSEKRPHLPPKVPSKPDFSLRNSTANLGMPKVPRERIHSDGGNNLAEVLKAKFESRKTTVEENGNTDDPIFNTFPKKSGVQISQLPISQTKSDPDFSNKKVAGKPALLPKFDKPVNYLRPSNKNDVGQKRFSMQEEGSELANALQARLRRQSNIDVLSSQHYSAVEKPKKSFPSKPIIPEKTINEEKRPMVPPKLQGKKTEAKENSVASEMKSKLESRSGTGWKKESSKPKSKPPVLAKPKKPQLQKQGAKNEVQTETKAESPAKSGFAKELASKLSSNVNKQDTNCEAKPPIPKKSPIVQKVYGSKGDNNVKEKESAPLKSSAQTYRSLAKYQAEGNGEISFEEGVQMEVLEKTEGWWLVRVGTSEGWAPVTYIEPCGVGLRSPSPVCDSGFTSPEEGSNSVTSVKYRTCAEFVPESETELGFMEGLIVEVLDASEDDWWYARVDGREGWVPAEYLEEV